MGLDMYMFSRSKEQIENHKIEQEEIEKNGFSDSKLDTRTEIAYWRKHRHIHNWMENVYFERGGEEEFNCVELPLTLDLLDGLESDIKSGAINDHEKGGFFFGDGDYTAEDREYDLEVIEKARQEINNGKEVFYRAWY